MLWTSNADRILMVKLYAKFECSVVVLWRWHLYSESPAPDRKTLSDAGKVWYSGISWRYQKAKKASLCAIRRKCGRSKPGIGQDPSEGISMCMTAVSDFHHINVPNLSHPEIKPHRPRFIHGLSSDDPDRRVEFCETFQNSVKKCADQCIQIGGLEKWRCSNWTLLKCSVIPIITTGLAFKIC